MWNSSGNEGVQITNGAPYGDALHFGGNITNGSAVIHTVPVDKSEQIQSYWIACLFNVSGSIFVEIYNQVDVFQYYMRYIYGAALYSHNEYVSLMPCVALQTGWYIKIAAPLNCYIQIYMFYKEFDQET